MAAVKEGQKWGALTCTYAGTIKEIITEGASWEERKFRYFMFDCECGGKLKVLQEEFKGKRLTQDCGCGRGRTSKTCAFTATMPIWLRTEVAEIAEQEGTNFSHMLTKLVRYGLERVETERVETK